MPATKIVNQATANNAMAGLQFNNVPPGYVTLYASCVTAGDTIGLTVGTQPIVDSAQPNIEASADVVDVDRDLIIAREPHNGGDIFLPVTATTAVNFLLISE